jgi:phosphoglycolate phosphatase
MLTLILDLDGTLVDSAPAILKGFEKALAAFALQPVCTLDDRLIGPPLLATLKKVSGIEDAIQLAAMADVFRAWYDAKGFTETCVYEGVDLTLRSLAQQGVPLYIATNKRLLPTLAILDYLAWTPLFTAVYALDRVTPAYQDKAAMLAALLDEQGIDVREAIYIGDTLGDFEAANRNGLRFAAANWGYGDLSGIECMHLAKPVDLLGCALGESLFSRPV